MKKLYNIILITLLLLSLGCAKPKKTKLFEVQGPNKRNESGLQPFEGPESENFNEKKDTPPDAGLSDKKDDTKSQWPGVEDKSLPDLNTAMQGDVTVLGRALEKSTAGERKKFLNTTSNEKTNKTPLQDAIEAKDIEKIKLLWKQSELDKIQKLDDQDNTYVHLAAKTLDTELIKVFLDNASAEMLNRQNDQHYTPLQAIISGSYVNKLKKNNISVLDLFLQNDKVDLNIASYGNTDHILFSLCSAGVLDKTRMRKLLKRTDIDLNTTISPLGKPQHLISLVVTRLGANNPEAAKLFLQDPRVKDGPADAMKVLLQAIIDNPEAADTYKTQCLEFLKILLNNPEIREDDFSYFGKKSEGSRPIALTELVSNSGLDKETKDKLIHVLDDKFYQFHPEDYNMESMNSEIVL